MCITEFNEKVFVDGIRAEGIEEGLEKGREEGREEGAMNARRSIIVNMHNKGFGLADIADMVQVSIETVKQCLVGAAIPPAK